MDAAAKDNASDEAIRSASLPQPELPDLILDEFDEEEVPIDDNEFHIPPVANEPTLDSILNDINDLSGSEDEGPGAVGDALQDFKHLRDIPEGSDTISIISKESSDNRSRNSSRSYRQRSHQSAASKKPTSMLRHVLLKEITCQLNSATEKINAGTSTALAIGTLVAVGTSHGFVFVFDSMQILKWCFGDQSHRDEGGAVSSLSISYNGTRLLIGFAKGLILMYDLENGKLLRTLHDAHAPGTAVLILRFTDYPVVAMCSDSGGSVFELNFKRTMGIRGCDSRCIFSGSRGEVCTFEPLLLSNYPDNPLNKYVIVALATLSKVIVVMIRPKLKVLFTHALTCDPTTLPLLQWQMVIIQTVKNDKIVDPVLTFARENTMYFYQTTMNSKAGIQFLLLQKIVVNYNLLSLHWLNSRTLAVVDTKERLRIVDARSQEEIESVDLSQARLVYASSHFKGLATGGNVSKAFASAGEKACYNSVLCLSNQIIVLGTKSVHALTMRSWHERLDYLMKQQQYTEALQLGYELYLEKAKAVVGLKGSKDSKRMVVREKLMYLLDRYIERIAMFKYMDDVSTAKQNYQSSISTCVSYLILIDHLTPVYEALYDICNVNPIIKAAYLESLEPFVLNDQLRAMPPTIVKEFISHYEECGNTKALEACIVHFNVECLDIHQTMKICWTHGLFDAILYIYNQGMMDYTSPLEELLVKLQEGILDGKVLESTEIALGNKMLVYISCCLAGRAYPYGDIPSSLVSKVQSDVFRCITTLHTHNASESEQAYPYVRTFLKFDTREFLNVLSLSFEESVFDTELGRRLKQRMVDILLQVMVEQGDFSAKQVGMLFTFLARQMAKVGSSLYVSKHLFEQVLEHLTSPKEPSSVEERQQALLELLQAGGLQHLEHDKLLEKCYEAKFYRVCEMLHERKQEYAKIIPCYLLDESRCAQVFNFIHKIFCAKPNSLELCDQIVSNIKTLVQIDSKKTARVIYLHMSSYLPKVVQNLESQHEELYQLLKGIFQAKEQNQANIQLDEKITEKYIELMCQKMPGAVQPFLKSVESYNLDSVLETCAKYNVVIATAYLLEKSGKLEEALTKMMTRFSELLTEATTGLIGETVQDESVKGLTSTELNDIFEALINFCKRTAPTLSAEEKQQLWVPLIELLLKAHGESHGGDANALLNEMTKNVMSSMMGHVPLPTIVEIVMNDPSHQKSTLAEIKDLVTGMFETCSNEETVVQLLKQISETDVHEKLAIKCKKLKKGFSPRSKICPMCHTSMDSFYGPRKDIIIFNCGHVFHHECVEDQGESSCTICLLYKVNQPSIQSSCIRGSERAGNRRTEDETESHIINHDEFELRLEAPTQVPTINEEL